MYLKTTKKEKTTKQSKNIFIKKKRSQTILEINYEIINFLMRQLREKKSFT